MSARKLKFAGYAVCLRNEGYEASLEVRKLYGVVADREAEAEGMMRVVDESGEDYLYPADRFERVALTGDGLRALGRAS
jgi:hypothetical protein